MAHQRDKEGAIEQVPRGNSPEPVSRRHFHAMHAPAQREGAVERVPLPGEEPAASSPAEPAPMIPAELAKDLDLAFGEMDRRIAALEHKNASHLDQDAIDHNSYARELAALREEQGKLAERITSAHDKIGNVLERLEALESLEAAAKKAAASPKTK